MKNFSLVLAMVLALFVAKSANATLMTLEFEGNSTGVSYVEAGMTISATSAEPIRTNGKWFLDCCDAGPETFSLSTGGVFDLVSVFRSHIDAADPVVWVGYFNGQVVASQSYNSGQNSVFNFAGFTGLDRVDVSVAGSWTDTSFDNLTYQASSIPEPTSIALISLALFGMTAARKRK